MGGTDDPVKNAEAAISNLKLYITGEGGDYNLSCAMYCIETAIEQEKSKKKTCQKK